MRRQSKPTQLSTWCNALKLSVFRSSLACTGLAYLPDADRHPPNAPAPRRRQRRMPTASVEVVAASGGGAMTAQPTTPGVALWAAERYNLLAGHQNLGPLSARYGFLPAPGANVRLPESHAAWDDVAATLPDLHRELTVRTTIDRMPVLSAERSALPDESLQRAAVVLGLLAHSYFHLSAGRPAAPPPAVARPWAEVCRRLGRSGPYLSYVDLIVCNWQLRDPAAADPMRVSNL